MYKLFCWFLLIIPTTIFPIIAFAYRRLLNHKLAAIESILHNSQPIERYIEIYRTKYKKSDDKTEKGEGREEIIKKLFLRFFHWKAYATSILFNMGITFFTCILVQIKMGIIAAVPRGFDIVLKGTPLPVIFGILGAYLWGIYDMLVRYRTVDLTPESMHFVWLRLLIAGSLGYIISPGFNESLGIFVAFAIGAFPIKTVRSFIIARAKKEMNLSLSKQPAEESEMHKIQGLSENHINRLAEEGVDSVEHLAFADPLILLFRTNIEWKVILDIIDQSILYVYIGDKALKLRPFGIRGAIELASIMGNHESDSEDNLMGTDHLIELISKKLGEDKEVVLNLVKTLYEDLHVQFIWALWDTILEFDDVKLLS